MDDLSLGVPLSAGLAFKSINFFVGFCPSPGLRVEGPALSPPPVGLRPSLTSSSAMVNPNYLQPVGLLA